MAERTTSTGDGPSRRRWLTPDDRDSVLVWAASRVAVAVLSVGGAWVLSDAQAGDVEGFLRRWDRWDVGLFQKVAEFGYTGYPEHYPDQGVEAFFPGAPMVLRLVHVVVPDWTAAGLLISLLAGALASVALGRLARMDGAPASRAVLYLVLSPYAVFLFAGYSEALFLACALWGWLRARQGHWIAASALVAAASTVRISGAFLACGLVVQYLVAHHGRLRTDAVALLAPFAAVAGYFSYLAVLTGDFWRWRAVQETGWGRRSTPPWDALRATLDAAAAPGRPAEHTWSFVAEIIAVAVGLALLVVLLLLRRWGEAVYVGLSVAALATSTYYLSVGRATLLWWPLYVLLALAAVRRPWLDAAYVTLAAPLMALLVLTFTAGRWVG